MRGERRQEIVLCYFLFQKLIPQYILILSPLCADVLQLADAADPIEFQWVITRRRIAEQRVHRHVVGKSPDGRAVLLGRRVDRRGGRKPRRCVAKTGRADRTGEVEEDCAR